MGAIFFKSEPHDLATPCRRDRVWVDALAVTGAVRAKAEGVSEVRQGDRMGWSHTSWTGYGLTDGTKMTSRHPHGKTWRVVLAALAIIVVIVAIILPALVVRCWVGRVELQVYVNIGDADTLKPLVGVPITILYGPTPPWEGTWGLPDPQVESANAQELKTDENGRAECSRRFFAAGSEGTFKHSGSIDLSRTWIRVAPPGYGEVFLPLDGQSVRPRDIDNRTPVYVTVLLKRPLQVSHSGNAPGK